MFRIGHKARCYPLGEDPGWPLRKHVTGVTALSANHDTTQKVSERLHKIVLKV
jgi:hypothetical protein